MKCKWQVRVPPSGEKKIADSTAHLMPDRSRIEHFCGFIKTEATILVDVMELRITRPNTELSKDYFVRSHAYISVYLTETGAPVQCGTVTCDRA